MSRVPENLSVGLDLGRVDWSPRERRMLGRISDGVKSANRRSNIIGSILNKEISAGYPEDENGAQVVQNIRGSWARAVLVAAPANGGPVTFTHNLNLPTVLVPGRAYNHFNVYNLVCRPIFGDRSGANAAPAAIATGAVDLLYQLGDAVTANAVDVRVFLGAALAAALAAAAPLTLDVFFAPALK